MVAGTDGNDFEFRQKVANTYQIRLIILSNQFPAKLSNYLQVAATAVPKMKRSRHDKRQ